MRNTLFLLVVLLCAANLSLAEETPAGSGGSRSTIAFSGKTLAEEWAPTENSPLRLHKQTYFLVTYTKPQNDAPFSPNPQNRVPFTYPLDHKDAKFQISLKSDLLTFGERHTLWAAYTQQSHWQVFDTKHSAPFRESNYEPELIYSYRPRDLGSESSLLVSFLNIAFVHQSNGQSLPRSRSWNRNYVQAGLEHRFDNGDRLALIPRIWKRVGGGGIDDDNPDIINYMGHGDLELRYYRNHSLLSATARTRAIQLGLALPLRILSIRNANVQLQYFHGYGESLIDYNHKHTTYGIGLSLPFEDSY